MELKEGMYIRTVSGSIGKFKKYTTDKKRTCETDMPILIDAEDIVKASHNIADLIEVGDYINGEYVDLFSLDFFKKHPEHIKSIVTHEQFKKMKYNVVNRVC